MINVAIKGLKRKKNNVVIEKFSDLIATIYFIV